MLKRIWRGMVFGLLAALTIGLSGCCDDDLDDQIRGQLPLQLMAPQAVDDSFNSLGNSPLNVTALQGVLLNDTVNASTLSGDTTSASGGTVTVATDGSFIYNPPFGFVGTDTFGYSLTNAVGASRGTVRVTITSRGFFVNNAVAPGGNGSFAAPFNALPLALAAAGPNDTIFVFRGDGTNNNLAGAVTLQDGQQLIGEAAGLDLSAINPQVVVSPGLAPSLTGPINLANGTTVRGFQISGSAADGVSATSVNGATVSQNEFSNYSNVAVDFDDCTGVLNITDNTFRAVNGNEAVDIDSNNANSTLNISRNTFTDDALATPEDAVDVETAGTSEVTVTATGNAFTSPDGTAGWSDGMTIAGSGGRLTFNASGNQVAGVRSDGVCFLVFGNAQGITDINNNTLSDCGDKAIELEVAQTANLMAEVTANTVTDPTARIQDCIDVDSFVTATGTVRIAGNNLTGGEDGIDSDVSQGSTLTLTIDTNTISSPRDDGVDLEASNTGGLTAIVLGNTVTGAGSQGFNGDAADGAILNVALRNNTLNGQVGDDIDLASAATSTACLDITGNSCDQMVLRENGTSTMNVERLDAGTGGPLQNVNTIAAGLAGLIGPPTARNAGFCGL